MIHFLYTSDAGYHGYLDEAVRCAPFHKGIRWHRLQRLDLFFLSKHSNNSEHTDPSITTKAQPFHNNHLQITMHFIKSTIALMAAFAFTNAAVVDLFSDTNCQVPAGSRNVWDNSCAPLGGFQSYRITSGGGGGQFISAYSRNACAGDVTSCVGAGSGGCFQAINGNGGSNAMSSGTSCGVS